MRYGEANKRHDYLLRLILQWMKDKQPQAFREMRELAYAKFPATNNRRPPAIKSLDVGFLPPEVVERLRAKYAEGKAKRVRK